MSNDFFLLWTLSTFLNSNTEFTSFYFLEFFCCWMKFFCTCLSGTIVLIFCFHAYMTWIYNSVLTFYCCHSLYFCCLLHIWVSSNARCNIVRSLSHVQLFATLWTAAHEASLSFTISLSLLKFMPFESVMPSNLDVYLFVIILSSCWINLFM